jgi:hypothetical protein
MIAIPLDSLFSNNIFPEFPFKNQGWIAVAFERNAHSNTRMPEWFFRSACKYYNPNGKNSLLIKGDFFLINGLEEVVEIAFDWDSYKNLIFSPAGFSLEYKMIDKKRRCACWADPELTIFGGEPREMIKLLDEYGGRDHMLKNIESEFFLDRQSGNEDMRAYFRGLLFPQQRITKRE